MTTRLLRDPLTGHRYQRRLLEVEAAKEQKRQLAPVSITNPELLGKGLTYAFVLTRAWAVFDRIRQFERSRQCSGVKNIWPSRKSPTPVQPTEKLERFRA